jgi:hypothetical protein
MSTQARSCWGALLQEGVDDLPIDMLQLEDVLICDVNLPVEVLKAGSLTEAHELVVDEAILDVVELVDVVMMIDGFYSQNGRGPKPKCSR